MDYRVANDLQVDVVVVDQVLQRAVEKCVAVVLVDAALLIVVAVDQAEVRLAVAVVDQAEARLVVAVRLAA